MSPAERAAVMRQGDRYLLASEQDRDPDAGLLHASYAHAYYEMLLSATPAIMRRIARAGAEQDRWSGLIRKRLGMRREIMYPEKRRRGGA